MHATDNIPEQIDLVKKLEEKGFTYKTSDGIYFDTSKFTDYFELSRQNPEELKAGVRVEMGEKKNASDFALWKFSPKDEKRQMEWESPWGVGFPGWHIECSAMSMKAIGNRLDIHTGGIDHINIHHTNEIAQSECATNEKPFSKYWIHHAFLMVEGEKMSKSIGNIFTVDDVVKKGFDPISLRYLYLQTHYRQEMNFTWDALEASQTALNKLRNKYLNMNDGEIIIPAEFIDAINDDLNLPKALSVVWENIESLNKSSLGRIDEVLGLQLSSFKEESFDIPEEISELVSKREEFRKVGNYVEADKFRGEIEAKGFILEDSPDGARIRKKT
jgi:cysteinyl-tRNA synthetase